MITPDQLQHLKFPIGTFNAGLDISKSDLNEMLNIIEVVPTHYKAITRGLSATDLKKTYREGAWNVQQLVNHVADMQLLHFFRMKSALTEADYKNVTLVNIPGWASTADGLTSPVEDSIAMIEAINKRFVYLMRSLNDKQLDITYFHPIRKETFNQRRAIALTTWHVHHHLEHIKIALAS